MLQIFFFSKNYHVVLGKVTVELQNFFHENSLWSIADGSLKLWHSMIHFCTQCYHQATPSRWLSKVCVGQFDRCKIPLMDNFHPRLPTDLAKTFFFRAALSSAAPHNPFSLPLVLSQILDQNCRLKVLPLYFFSSPFYPSQGFHSINLLYI